MLGLDAAIIQNNISTWEMRIHPSDLDQTMQEIHDFVNGKITRFENIHRLRKEDGAWIWVLAKGKLIYRKNEGPCFTGTHFEISGFIEAQLQSTSLQKNGKIGDGSCLFQICRCFGLRKFIK